MDDIRLVKIPDHLYEEYKLKVIFDAYKWDPQVEDENTVSPMVVVLKKSLVDKLTQAAEGLYHETVCLEQALLKNLKMAKKLSIGTKTIKLLKKAKTIDVNKHVRLMRFDFHLTTTGWQISEVNSDVPGGFAEASIMPKIACQYLEKVKTYPPFGESLYQAFKKKLPQDAKTMAFVHATSYSDDRQVMQFIGDYFVNKGYRSIYLAPDLIVFKDGCAYDRFTNCKIDGLVRFYPLEWLTLLPKHQKGFYQTSAVSCNYPVAVLTQSKRLPLVFEKLGVEVPFYKKYLPLTVASKPFKKFDDSWIFKPVLGRVGEGISIKEAITQDEYQKIIKSVKRYPLAYVAQKRFESVPLTIEENNEIKKYHLCLGVFCIDGKCAGFYGRISTSLRIDGSAHDIPIVIEEGEM